MALTNDELRAQIKANTDAYINRLLLIFKEDPDLEEMFKDYKSLPEYVNELIEKDGSFVSGLISALECYLKK